MSGGSSDDPASGPQVDPRIGLVLDGRYRIDAPIAAGGMGVVYRAERIGIGKKVAIKFLHHHAARDPDHVRRFEREAEAMSRVTHPHLASVIDHGVLDQTPYLVMEYHPGETLADVLDRGALPPVRATVIARQIASGMQGIHAAGVVHRDLKPDNVVLLADLDHDFIKILDFGIAKMVAPREGEPDMTAVGHAIGTPSYMSPEQARGLKLDPRSDLYAFGVILFEMVTGRRPFAADEKLALLRMHVEDQPPLPRDVGGSKISEPLERLILKLLAKEPGDRFASAQELSSALLELPEAMATPSAIRAATMPVDPAPSARSESPTVIDKTPSRELEPEAPAPGPAAAKPAIPTRVQDANATELADEPRPRERKRRHGIGIGLVLVLIGIGIAIGFMLRDPRVIDKVRGAMGHDDAGVDAAIDAAIDAAVDAPIDAVPDDASVDAPEDAPVDAEEPDAAPPPLDAVEVDAGDSVDAL